MFVRSLLVVFLMGWANSSLQGEQPTIISHRLIEAIRNGEKKAILPLHADLNGRAAAWVDMILEIGGGDFNAPTWCFDEKTKGEAAVVAVGSLPESNKLDIDPIYMIRVDGEWRALPGHTMVDAARGVVPDSTMQSLQELADWFKPRKKELYEELNKELMASWKKETPPAKAEVRELMIKVFSKRDPKGFATAKAK